MQRRIGIRRIEDLKINDIDCVIGYSLAIRSPTRPVLLEISPQPLEGFRENRTAVFSTMGAASPDHPVVVFREPQGCFHLLVCQRPVAVSVVEVIESVLKKHANGLGLSFSNEGGIDMTPSNVDKATDVADYLAECIRSLPGDSERTNASRAIAADRSVLGFRAEAI